MTINNSEFMPSMFIIHYELICFIISIKLLFCIYLLGLLIVDQLFFESINTLDFTKYSSIINRANWL